MKILLAGASGYIGKRLLPELAQNGHQAVKVFQEGCIGIQYFLSMDSYSMG